MKSRKFEWDDHTSRADDKLNKIVRNSRPLEKRASGLEWTEFATKPSRAVWDPGYKTFIKSR